MQRALLKLLTAAGTIYVHTRVHTRQPQIE